MSAGGPTADGAIDDARLPDGARLGDGMYVAHSADQLLVLKARNLKTISTSAMITAIFLLAGYCFHATTSIPPKRGAAPGFFDEMSLEEILLLLCWGGTALFWVIGTLFALGLEYRIDGRYRTIERRRLINAFPKTWQKEDLGAVQLAPGAISTGAEAYEVWRVQLVNSRGKVIARICHQHAGAKDFQNIAKTAREIGTLLDIPLVTKERGEVK